MNVLLAQADGVYQQTVWMPKGASIFAAEVDWVFYFIFYVSIFFFIVIGGCMFWFAWKYRQKDPREVKHGSHHNNALEITWSVIPLIIVLAIFIWGFRGFLNMTQSPGESYEINVNAKKWSWEFTYPEGVTSPILHVPADTPIRLILNSQDVIHSLYVPAFRQKKDVVPGRYNNLWFQTPWDENLAKPNQEYPLPGGGHGQGSMESWDHPTIIYDLYCTEYCGTRHSWMWTKVVVHPRDQWQNVVDKLGEVEITPEGGHQIYLRRGCNQCHTDNGAAGIGPTFRDLFGRQENFADGSTLMVDENYVRESVHNPGAKIVAGFQNVMPTISLKDEELQALILWMKSISQHAPQVNVGQQTDDAGAE